MATRSYMYFAPAIGGTAGQLVNYVKLHEDSSWNRSARVGGKLVLKPQSALMRKAHVSSYTLGSVGTLSVAPPGANIPFIPRPPGLSAAVASLDNQALARFNGKLRKGSASLGVTAASWRQSRDMIVGRVQHMQRTVDSAYHGLLGNKHARERLRRERQPLANQVLETEFGWAPLFQDIYAALYTVCDNLAAEWVTSRARGTLYEEKDNSSSGRVKRQSWEGRLWTTYNARVTVTNHNLWLLNRLGLINPATVIWDLVPWSFLVNMFVNVNQLVSSVTDEVGLSITDQNTTRGQEFHLTTTEYDKLWPPTICYVQSVVNYKEVSRNVAGAPALSLELRVPKLDWNLAVIATSLLVQKANRLNKLIRAI